MNTNLKLNLKGTKRISAGHPWLRRGDLQRFRVLPEAGLVVRLQDAMGNFLGWAVSDGPSSGESAFRVLSRQRHPIFDQAWFEAAFELALSKRRGLAKPGLETWLRLVHGEADALPGLTLDQVGPAYFLKISSVGMASFTKVIEAALRAQLAPKTLWAHWPGDEDWRCLSGEAARRDWPGSRDGLRMTMSLEPDLRCLDAGGQSARAAWLKARCADLLGPGLAFDPLGGPAWPVLALGSRPRVLVGARLPGVETGQDEVLTGDPWVALERAAARQPKFSVIHATLPESCAGPRGRLKAVKDLEKMASRIFAAAAPGAWLGFYLPGGGMTPAHFQERLLATATGLGLGPKLEGVSRPSQDFPEIDAFPEGKQDLWAGFSLAQAS